MNLAIIPPRWTPYLDSLMRLVVGLLFMEHGTGKLLNFPAIHDKMLSMMGSGMLYFTGTFELVGGLLIAIGFLTRPVAFLLSGFMAVAYFLAHFPQSFYPLLNMGEPAILYCFVFLYLAAAGGGPLSVDRLLSARRSEGVLGFSA
jgi:putative oxidoreductase